MPYRVRSAGAPDVPQLVLLARRYWDFENICGFEALRIELLLGRLLAEPRLGGIWVAQDAHGAILGYAIVVQMLSFEHQGLMAEIDELYVLPESRGRGVGTALLAAVETALTRSGGVRLQLQLGTGNEGAREFYRRSGYAARSGFELWDKALPAPESPAP